MNKYYINNINNLNSEDYAIMTKCEHKTKGEEAIVFASSLTFGKRLDIKNNIEDMKIYNNIVPTESETITETIKDKNEIDFKELETIIDQALIESEINEINEMNRDITNKEILVEALRNKSKMLDIKDEIKTLDNTVAKGNSNIDSFLKKGWKLISTIALLMFLNGYFLAVNQHENIKPFIVDIVKEVVKKVAHTSGD